MEAPPSHLSLEWTSPRDPLQMPLRPVIATGAFDILHIGHLRLLEEAHRRGHPFAVGVESDERVRAWKGPTRPLNTELDRAALLSALRCVDGVFIVAGDPARTHWRDYARLLAPLRPAALVFTQGDPYDGPKRRAAVELGAQVWEVPHVPKRSTSGIVDRMGG